MLSHILHDHNPLLLSLAVAVCLLGAGSGILLWNRAINAVDRNGLHWGFLASVILGATIWTTHFVAMLGYSGSYQASFAFDLTALSIAAAVIGVSLSVGISIAWRDPLGQLSSGAILGVAISVMHFTGMMGYKPGPGVTWSGLWSPEAVLMGVVFGIATVRLLNFENGTRPMGRGASVCFTLAVAGMHFTAMAQFHARLASTVGQHGSHAMTIPAGTADHTGLAISVSLITIILIGTGLSGYLLQNRLTSQSAEQLSQSARTDPLTGVSNRTGFNTELARRCRAWTDGGAGFALLFIDLDRFKPVNDVFGHPIGDEVLRRVVQRLQAVTGPDDLVSRLGGDEFAMILGDCDPTAIERSAARIVDLMARPFLIDTRIIDIGASVGIAEPRTSGKLDPVDLCRDADMALYAAKSGGRGTWQRFELDIARQFEARRRLEYDLRRAISRDEFELYFQPVVQSTTLSLLGAEALLRWRHPTRGLLTPDHFVGLAEELGLVMQIGKWVIEHACLTAATWPDPMKVSVNISPMQLRDPRLVQTIGDALKKSGLAARRLDIEVTESALIENEARAIDLCQQLRNLGVSISLDDFGTGFSSLSYLHKFPLDRIKIDRSFVETAGIDPKSARIVEAISHLGTVLGLGVTAEGVETESQLSMVTSNGCDVIQGFLISRPIPTDMFDDLMREDYDFGRRTGT